MVTVSISDHFNHSNSKVFLCNVYISISITYLNSKFGISSKKNILVSYSQRYGFAFYIVTEAYMLVKAGVSVFQLEEECRITGPHSPPGQHSVSGEMGWLQAGTLL